MGYRRENEPSPLRTGLVHAALSLSVFGGLAVALGAGIHVVADPDAASPKETIALFDVEIPVEAPVREVRVASVRPTRPDEAAIGALNADDTPLPPAGGDLAVVYSDIGEEGLRIDITGGQGGPAPGPQGVRINGQIVPVGRSFAEMQASGVAPSPMIASATAATKTQGPSRIPAERFARPFSNPEGRPVVALVIGGLGISPAQTEAAIADLPADVTLSFAPDSKKLDHWVKMARADGHEVLIEVPMEAFDYGRMKMHPDTLLVASDPAANLARLDRVIGRATGFFGIINYQGAKFATDDRALAGLMDALAARGLAFIDDGTVQRAGFSRAATERGVHFARAAGPIDARQTAEDISAELIDLESLALEHGAAFGSGFAFPATIESVKIWIEQLDEKGIALAPVSALMSAPKALTATAGRSAASGLKTGG